MDRSFFVVVTNDWISGKTDASVARRLQRNSLIPIGSEVRHLADGCNLLVKYRDDTGTIQANSDARIVKLQDNYFVRSEGLANSIRSRRPDAPYLALFFEGTSDEARCIVQPWTQAFLDELEKEHPTVRFGNSDLPPVPGRASFVDVSVVLGTLYRASSANDPELFAVHTSRFMDSPSVITALFNHVMSIQSEDHLRFPIQVKRIAEHIRSMLLEDKSSIGIRSVKQSHLELWSKVEKSRFGFLDGGMARIPNMGGIEPLALRVGVYSVRPGLGDPSEREQWDMKPYIVGDLLDRRGAGSEQADPRRLREAARYLLEPLTGLRHLSDFPDTKILFLHGPLITQFLTYDEGPPYYLPFLSEKFLRDFDMDRTSVAAEIKNLPRDAHGDVMWNQFMAIYGYVERKIEHTGYPIVGVVERAVGRRLTETVLGTLQQEKVIGASYVKDVHDILRRYDIVDDFLFGCLLKKGEYITPVRVNKNPPRRARDRWQPVVAQYPQPYTTMMKTEETNFPFRIEMNPAAFSQVTLVAEMLYHTARLLPNYAFPVGLDIADRFAKIPDWISKGISAELSASVLHRALQTGDANVVAQTRRFLARGPRDFFYRPNN